jgi:crossover junction endodeoxyribonuclease RuvC
VFVLGVDPGLSRCGYGVVERVGRGQRAVAAGVFRTDPDDAVSQRLLALRDDVRALLGEHRPDVVAVERVFFQVNARTAIPVAQAAGVVMVEAAGAGCEVVEYSPNQVKQAVSGMGGADKEQVQRMVQTLLGLPSPLRPVDAADAVAVALCHLAHAPLQRRLGPKSSPDRTAKVPDVAAGARRSRIRAQGTAAGDGRSSAQGRRGRPSPAGEALMQVSIGSGLGVRAALSPPGRRGRGGGDTGDVAPAGWVAGVGLETGGDR